MDGNSKASAGGAPSEAAKRTFTITRRQHDLIRLRDAATVLLDLLPGSARDLRSATQWMESCRRAKDGNEPVLGSDAEVELRKERENYRTLWECGIEYANMVGELVWDANRLLPDMGKELHHLPGLKPHDWQREQFDLEPALAELRTIRAQAIHHCGVPASVLYDRAVSIVIVDDETPALAPHKTPQKNERTPPVNSTQKFDFLEILDDWWDQAKSHVDDFNADPNYKPVVSAEFQHNSDVVAAWCEDNTRIHREPIDDLYRWIRAIGSPGPPWGPKPTPEMLLESAAKCRVIIDRINRVVDQVYSQPETESSAMPANHGHSRKPRRRGPEPVHDATADAKLVGDWQAAKRQGTTRKDFCKARDIKLKALIDAQTRRRERVSRAAKQNTGRSKSHVKAR